MTKLAASMSAALTISMAGLADRSTDFFFYNFLKWEADTVSGLLGGVLVFCAVQAWRYRNA